MKTLLLLGIVFGVFYAVLPEIQAISEDKDSLMLYSILEFRDSNGNLIAYFVDDSPFIPDLKALEGFLNTAPEQLTTISDNKKIIITSGTLTFSKEQFSPSTTFGNVENGQYVVYALSSHDGIPVEPGDILRTTWVAIIPLN